MRLLLKYIWAILPFISGAYASASLPADSVFIYKTNEINSDPLTGKRYFGALKVSTLQVLFSEAPFTFEVFMRNDLSLQIQAGIIFPLESDSFLAELFRAGTISGASGPKDFFSYRNSPYNNHGLSFKFEVRMYKASLYLAPQLMYKFSGYDNSEFPVEYEGKQLKQTESKKTNIAGLGLMLGRQNYFMKQVTDWYIGAGIRIRSTVAEIHKIRDDENHTVILPERFERSGFAYPFINAGFRIGLVL